eukprot:gene7139-11452_t
MSFKNLFSCEVTTPKSPFIEKKTKLAELYDEQKKIKNELNQIEEDFEKLLKIKQETIDKNDKIQKDILKIEQEMMELISPSPENTMFDDLKPKRRTLSETNDIFPEKKMTPKKSPSFPTSTKSYNDFSYKTLYGHFEGVLCVGLSSVAKRVITGSMDKRIIVWDLHKYKQILSIDSHKGWVKCILTDNGERFYTGSGDKTIKIWDMYTGQCKNTLVGHQAGITSLFCDRASLASSSLDTTIRWWDKHTGICVSELKGHEQYVKSVKFYEYALASAGADSIKLWDMRTSECVRTLENSANMNTLQFTEDQIIGGSRDGELKIFNLKTGEIEFEKQFKSTISCTAYDDDGKVFIVGDKMQPILFDPIEDKILRTFPGHSKAVSDLCFENNILATASLDKSIKLWNL